jgi:hypothetical protein
MCSDEQMQGKYANSRNSTLPFRIQQFRALNPTPARNNVRSGYPDKKSHPDNPKGPSG